MEAVLRLEAEWSRWAGVQNVVACSSGSAALHLALEALRLPPGSGVIVPDFTIISVPRACTLAGLVPVFVDVTPDTLLLDPDRLDEACSSHPNVPIRAVMPVATYGRACQMDEIAVLANKYGLAIVEDLAEAHGVPPHPRTDAACWSLFKNKIICSQEGGLIAFRDPCHAALARQLRCIGFDDNHDFRHIPRGVNARLANVLAEMALESLAEADANLERRLEIEGWYERLCPQEWRMPRRDVVWVVDVRIPGMSADQQNQIVRALQSVGIAARHAFKPMSGQEEYRNREHSPAPNSAKAAVEIFYLPADPKTVTEDTVKLAFEVIRHVLGY